MSHVEKAPFGIKNNKKTSPNTLHEKSTSNIEAKETKKKSRLARILAVGSMAVVLLTYGVRENLNNPGIKAENPPTADIESTQVTHEIDTEENYEQDLRDHKSDIAELKASTIDQLSREDVLVESQLSQENVDIFGSYYLEELVDAGTLYGYTKEDRHLDLDALYASQKALLDEESTPEKGQAMLDVLFDLEITAYSKQGAEGRILVKMGNYIDYVGNGTVHTSNACSSILNKIEELENKGAEKGSKVIISITDQDKPKFISFVEDDLIVKDPEGNTYKGYLIEYETQDKILYSLVAESDKPRFNYKEGEIKYPIKIVDGETVELTKQYANNLVEIE